MAGNFTSIRAKRGATRRHNAVTTGVEDRQRDRVRSRGCTLLHEKMQMRGPLAVAVVALLELFAARAAQANDDVHRARARAARLELSLAWPQPPAPPLIPPVGAAAIPGTPAPLAAPPIAHAGGPQITMVVLMTLVGDIAGLLAATGTGKLWAGAIPWALAPFGAAALVCNAGTAIPGRCRASLAGALIGAAVGLLPGMLIIASAGSEPETEGARDAYHRDRLTGFETVFVLYGLGVSSGTIIGYNLGGTAQPNQAAMPPVAMAPVFTLRF